MQDDLSYDKESGGGFPGNDVAKIKFSQSSQSKTVFLFVTVLSSRMTTLSHSQPKAQCNFLFPGYDVSLHA